MKTVDFLPAALDEAEASAAWYAKRDPRVAVRFAAELEAVLNQIANAPRQWPIYLASTRGVRLRRFPYLVIYRDEPSRILVVAIAHAKRKPGYWKKR